MSDRARPRARTLALRAASVAGVLLFAHCAWQRPGVGASVAIRGDDPPGPRIVLDARGAEHVVDRAALSIRSIALLPCPGEELVHGGALELLGPARASAHHAGSSAIGPLAIDLAADGASAADDVELLPGRYCDVRISIDALSLSADGGAIVLGARVDRDVVLRVPERALDEPGDQLRVEILASASAALERVDPGALEPDVAALSALASVAASLRVAAPAAPR